MDVIKQEVIYEQLILRSDIYFLLDFAFPPLLWERKVVGDVKKMFLFLFVSSF